MVDKPITGLEALKLIPQGWGVENAKNGKNYDGDELIKTIEKDLKEKEKQDKKLKEYKSIEEELGCPIEVIFAVFKAIKQGFIFIDLENEVYKEVNIWLDYEDISEDEEGYIGGSKSTNYRYILDYDARIFVEDYKKTWWLKEDKSE